MSKLTLTYIGRRLVGKNGKLTHCFREADKDGLVYWAKAKSTSFAGCTIGDIFDLPDSTLPVRWLDHKTGQQGPDECARNEAQDIAAMRAAEDRKIAPSPRISDAVQTLRTAYAAVPFNQRTSFEVWLLREVRK